ncbi:MAG: pilus assembly protein PilP [Proteobacteria bacterium]|nr:pilus assembly protein PilP [Pseudomonadota bacterium]MCL2307213.1 pilus assembly protein PilP [Pseudomonadota bacterium]
MRQKYLILCVFPFLLAACGEPHGDLRAWMNEQGKGQRGKIEPIPEVQEYEPFTYNAYDMQDPFFPRKMDTGDSKKGGPQPRKPEPLEAYPLDGLKMVGTLERSKVTYGLIQAPGKDIYQVSVGNYMGQDYGRIISITETEIQLKELVQDGTGDWTDRLSSLHLVESEQK